MNFKHSKFAEAASIFVVFVEIINLTVSDLVMQHVTYLAVQLSEASDRLRNALVDISKKKRLHTLAYNDKHIAALPAA